MLLNWDQFRVKFNGKETSAFEQLSYHLFCFEFNIKKGLHRYFNQVGIETEPIEFEGEKIGFQAKFFDKKLSQSKTQILSSLKKAKSTNPDLDRVIFYVNQEFGQSRKKDQKDPQYKIDIEKEAHNLSLELEWRVTSHFEQQLSSTVNLHLARYYFEDEKNDFGHVLSPEFFIEYYDNQNKSIAASLSIAFVSRIEERASLLDEITKNEIVVVSGESGIGKTRLALEVINDFVLENDNYRPYCISKGGKNLEHDLTLNLSKADDLILFVDDVNRLNEINDLIHFMRLPREGSLKVVCTVRKYAEATVLETLKDIDAIRPFEVYPPSESVVDEILSNAPFNLEESSRKEILHLCGNNPRMAIMAAKLVLENGNLMPISMKNLYKEYFSTFSNEINIKSKPNHLMVLGYISFFRYIQLDKSELLKKPLEDLNLEEGELREIIEELHQYEMIDERWDVALIPDQNLSNYFFYEATVNQKVLPLSDLLIRYFETNEGLVRDSLIPAVENFAQDNDEQLRFIKECLQNTESTLVTNDAKWKFYRWFGNYSAENALLHCQNYLDSEEDGNVELLDFEKNSIESFSRTEYVIEILGLQAELRINGVFLSSLLVKYIQKFPVSLGNVLADFQSKLIIKELDVKEKLLFHIEFASELKKLSNAGCKVSMFLMSELAKTLLQFRTYVWEYVNGVSKEDRYLVQPTIKVLEFRELVWSILFDLWEQNQKLVLNFLHQYSSQLKSFGFDEKLLFTELRYIKQFLENYFDPTEFSHGYEAIILITGLKKYWGKDFTELYNRFDTLDSRLYSKICWDSCEVKNKNPELGYKEREELVENELKEFAIDEVGTELPLLIKGVNNILKCDRVQEYSIQRSLTVIVNELWLKNVLDSISVLKALLQLNDKSVIQNTLRYSLQYLKDEDRDEFLKIVEDFDAKNFSFLRYTFLSLVKESIIIGSNYPEKLLNILQEIPNDHEVFLSWYAEYLKVKPQFYEDIIRLAIEKNSNEKTSNLVINPYGLMEIIEHIDIDIEEWKQLYLQLIKLDSDYDYNKEFLFFILKFDSTFFLKVCKDILSSKMVLTSHELHGMNKIWSLDNAEILVAQLFEMIDNHDVFFKFSDHEINVLFDKYDGVNNDRQKIFLIGLIEAKYAEPSLIKLILNVVRYSFGNSILKNVLFEYLNQTKDLEHFSRIGWIKTNHFGPGGTNFREQEKKDWKDLLLMLDDYSEKSQLLQIINYIKQQLKNCEDGIKGEEQRNIIYGM